MFATEQEMSNAFERFLKANFGNAYLKEQVGLFGIPDFVFYFKIEDAFLVISFELKLKDWKRATKQAFRYKSFSNMSFVVIPSQSVHSALQQIDIFEKYNIGLAQFDKEKHFEILYKPEISKPYSDSLVQKLMPTLNNSRKKAKNSFVFTNQESLNHSLLAI